MKKPWSSYHTFLIIEIAITLIIGVVFAFLEWKFSVLIAAIGAMIAVAMHAIPLRIGDEIRTEIEDVKATSHILDLCRQVELPDLQSAKRAILDDSIQSLRELSECKIFNERFYAWVFQQVDEAGKSIKAVSAMMEDQWALPREVSYYERNRRAVDRNVKVTRIFLTTNDRLSKKENRHPILLHLLHGLDAHIVFAPQARTLPGNELIVNGITIFDDQVLYQDVTLPPGDSMTSAGGKIIYEATDVRRTIDKFDALVRLSEEPLRVLSRISGSDPKAEMSEILISLYGTYQNLKDAVVLPGHDRKTDKCALTYWEKIEQGVKLV